MQTNSPPKLDTQKDYFLPLSKKISTPPKQNKLDSHISSKSPLFCHVLTKTTHSKSKQKHRQQRIRENRESRKQLPL